MKCKTSIQWNFVWLLVTCTLLLAVSGQIVHQSSSQEPCSLEKKQEPARKKTPGEFMIWESMGQTILASNAN
jgi:hypothetical protein